MRNQDKQEQFVILIPAYNAAPRIHDLLVALKSKYASHQIIVIDDGSTDQTGEIILEQRVNLISHPKNYGKGVALNTGFEHLNSRDGWEAVITMDADMQHDIASLDRFMTQYSTGKWDLILGRRNFNEMPVVRKYANLLSTFALSIRCGRNLKDSQCGYRLISKKALENLTLQTKGHQIETEILLKAVRIGFKVGFVDIPTIYDGEMSHVNPFRQFKDFISLLVQSIRKSI